MSLPFLEPTNDRSMNPKVKKVNNNKNLNFGLSPLKSQNSLDMIRYVRLGYLKQH